MTGMIWHSRPYGGACFISPDGERMEIWKHDGGYWKCMAEINGTRHVMISESHGGISKTAAKRIAEGLMEKAREVAKECDVDKMMIEILTGKSAENINEQQES